MPSSLFSFFLCFVPFFLFFLLSFLLSFLPSFFPYFLLLFSFSFCKLYSHTLPGSTATVLPHLLNPAYRNDDDMDKENENEERERKSLYRYLFMTHKYLLQIFLTFLQLSFFYDFCAYGDIDRQTNRQTE